MDNTGLIKPSAPVKPDVAPVPEFVIKGKIAKPAYKLKLGGIFNEFSWKDSSPPILTAIRD